MTIKGIWKNMSKEGQPVELVETKWHGTPNRNGKTYSWQSVETGCIREVIHNCENEEEAIRRTSSQIIIEKHEVLHPCQCGSGEERMFCSAPFGWDYCG